MRYSVVCLWLVSVAIAHAQPRSTPDVNPNGTAVPQASPLQSAVPAFNQNNAKLEAALAAFIQKMAKEPAKKTFDWSVLVGTLVGGLLSALVTFVTLSFNAKREDKKMLLESQRQRESARLSAQISYADKLLQVRLDQLQNFFAPLHSLLQQSKGVYTKVEQLLLKDPTKYRRVPDTDFKDGRTKMEVLWNGTWKDFRWLDQLPELKADPRIKPLVDEVVRIGKRMTKIISKYGALAANQQVLSDTYGKYLAHFAILSAINEDTRVKPYAPGEQEYGYYPRELNDEVKAGYEFALESLRPYFEASNKVLNDIKNTAG